MSKDQALKIILFFYTKLTRQKNFFQTLSDWKVMIFFHTFQTT